LSEKDLSFEEALEKLEGIVDKMESGGLGLDEALEKYTEGVKLIKFCSRELNKAEKRIEMVIKEGEEFSDIISYPDI